MSLDSDVRRLAGVRPLDALPREALQLLAFSCEKRRLRSGEILFSADDAADGGFVVLEGEIVLTRDGAAHSAHAGALIGESALIAETRRPADAKAATDSVLLRIPRETFRRVLTEFPGSAAHIQRVFAARAGAMLAALEKLRRSGFAEPGA